MIARLLHALHILILAFVLMAWLLPWQFVWIVHLMFIPGMILHWYTNANRCVLTEIEAKYRVPEVGVKKEADEGYFIKTLWAKFFGRVPSEKTLIRVIYAVMALVWSLSLIRLFRVF
jgi:hypothetical protein